MPLKHKLFYIVIGIILLAALQVGFHLITKPAIANNHQAQEAESQPEPIKIYISLITHWVAKVNIWNR